MNNNSRPNILILILDAVRAKNVSCYGYTRETTPNIDAFASDSTIFRNAFSTSTWTIPTHASMLSGLYLSQHRIENVKADRKLNEEIVSLPSVLRANGYLTAAFSQNFLFSPKYHFGGFNEFYTMENVFSSRKTISLLKWLSQNTGSLADKTSRYLIKILSLGYLCDSLATWMEASKEPFFLIANITNAHYPWAPPPGILLDNLSYSDIKKLLIEDFVTLKPYEYNSGKKQIEQTQRIMWRKLYDAAIMHVDREVGRLIERLRKWKGWTNTIMVLTADHGELIGDYRDIVGHMLSLHDNLIHVPLIVHHPDFAKGLVVENVVQNIDLFTSVLDWSNSSIDKVHPTQLQRPSLSYSITHVSDSSGYAFAEEDYTDSYAVIEGLLGNNPSMSPNKYPRQQIAVRSAAHKYIWRDDLAHEFYNLSTDPGEEFNRISTEDIEEIKALEDLQQVLDVWRSKMEVFPPQSVEELMEDDPRLLEHLKRLGYMA